MQPYYGVIISGIAISLLGGLIVFVIKSTLKGFILDMQDKFTTIAVCELKHKSLAEERESMRDDIQNHEDRLTNFSA